MNYTSKEYRNLKTAALILNIINFNNAKFAIESTFDGVKEHDVPTIIGYNRRNGKKFEALFGPFRKMIAEANSHNEIVEALNILIEKESMTFARGC